MKGITDDIISLPKIVKGMGYKCKLDGVDNGWEGLYRIDDKGNEYGHIPLVWDDKAGLWFIHFSVGESELAAFKNRRHRACVFRKQLKHGRIEMLITSRQSKQQVCRKRHALNN